ncbi:hypothetical protein Pint_22979 [Pistacia integerrima]|uniref:Uncharacterized protein n=1 Tax=Pistacia integerrima TaxID=434235 RepID=A0ACC0YMU7_9ROSI|nr:hypothetical protein Pint_22979 [Pistacia integerrima]
MLKMIKPGLKGVINLLKNLLEGKTSFNGNPKTLMLGKKHSVHGCLFGKDYAEEVVQVRKKNTIPRWQLMCRLRHNKMATSPKLLLRWISQNMRPLLEAKHDKACGSEDLRSSKPLEKYGSMNPEIARSMKPSVQKEIHMEMDNQGC